MSIETQHATMAGYEPTTLRTERLIDHFPIMEEVLEGREDNVLLVRADDGPAGTFKDRGPGLLLHNLYEQGVRHVAVSSAGNHLRGTIYSAAPLGIKLTGVLPANAPQEKRRGSEQLWVERGGRPEDLTLLGIGETYDDADRFLQKNFPELPRVHAFNDPLVIEGRKSLAYDIAHTIPDINITVSASGGGSLLASSTAGFRDLGLPVTTLGVEAEGSDSLSQTLRAGSEVPIKASNPNKRFKGLCVDYVGPYAVSLLVACGFTEDRLTRAINEDVQRLAESYDPNETDYLEPSSLVAVAGLINFINEGRIGPHDKVAVIASGRNEHPSRLAQHNRDRKLHVASAQILRW